MVACREFEYETYGPKILIIITIIMIIRLISIFLFSRFYRVSEFDVILNRLLVEIPYLFE